MRSLTYARQASPAQVLASLDQAMRGLAVDTYVTAILAHIERDQFKAQWGLRTLRWCNAGHPPAVLGAPDGHSRLLEARPDLLLGLGGGERADHTLTLAPGSSLVFYTDGLVERREIPLDDRLHSLGDTLAGRNHLDAELCNRCWPNSIAMWRTMSRSWHRGYTPRTNRRL